MLNCSKNALIPADSICYVESHFLGDVMYQRSLIAVLKYFSSIYFAIGITGPYQSGKTMLAKEVFPHLPYVSLEKLELRSIAKIDPELFLKTYKDGAVFDRIGYVPELILHLKKIGSKSTEKGRYVLIDSSKNQEFQPLEGLIGTVTVLPLSLAELGMPRDMNQNIFKGGYPRLHYKKMVPEEFFPSFLCSYTLPIFSRGIHGKFQTFMKLCAINIGQSVDLISLAHDQGISKAVAHKWLLQLEASYIIFFLHPFYKNFSKRLIKMPKMFFYDTGLACHLLGMDNESQVGSHYLKGALYENMVIAEILKGRLNRAQAPNLYFWRDKTGHEIDLIGEWGGKIKAIEIKSGATFQPEFLKNVRYFYDLSQKDSAGAVPVQSYLIYGGDYSGDHMQTKLVPFAQMDTVLQD